MDFLTQVALGGVIGHAVANTKTSTPLGKKAIITGALLGALPDADVLIQFGNDVNNFIYHRSFSHSVFVLMTLSICLYFLANIGLKKHLKKYNLDKVRLLLLVALPLLTHPILDSFTVYGTQLFWPLFTDLNGRSPESWSTLFIIDPIYTTPLLIALYYAIKYPPKVKASVLALGFSCCYLAFSLGVKQLIETRANELAKQNNIHDAKIVTIPTPFNTLLWRAVIMQDNHYQTAYISLFNQKKAFLSEPIKHNKKITELNNQRSPNHRGLLENNDALKKLDWFTHGFYRLDEDDNHIIATDLRMGVEGAYVFRFAIAHTSKESQDKKIPFKLRNDIDFSKLKGIYRHF